ncbi:MAG: hypothetical protein ACE5IC_09950 [Candidatus Brocadiales bacterium]
MGLGGTEDLQRPRFRWDQQARLSIHYYLRYTVHPVGYYSLATNRNFTSGKAGTFMMGINPVIS